MLHSVVFFNFLQSFQIFKWLCTCVIISISLQSIERKGGEKWYSDIGTPIFLFCPSACPYFLLLLFTEIGRSFRSTSLSHVQLTSCFSSRYQNFYSDTYLCKIWTHKRVIMKRANICLVPKWVWYLGHPPPQFSH